MRKLLQKLPFPVEYAIVTAGAVGLAFVYGVLRMLHVDTGMAAASLVSGHWRSIAVEAVTLLVLGLFLKGRGWTFERLGLTSHWSDGLWGIALVAGYYFATIMVVEGLKLAVPGLAESLAAQAAAAPPPKLPLPLVGALVVVSSFYTEFFLTGYAIAALKEKGLDSLAVDISVLLRLMTIIAFGPLTLVVMIPKALIFSIWFVRSGRLWPVIVAQAVITLVQYSYSLP